jgi:hypothetical protein
MNKILCQTGKISAWKIEVPESVEPDAVTSAENLQAPLSGPVSPSIGS